MSGKTTAKIIGDALVVEFGAAEEISTWRHGMDTLSNANFTVKVKNKKHVLILSTENKEEEIARFAEADTAANALKNITKALLSYRPVDPKLVHHVGKPFYKKAWFYLFIILVAIFFLVKASGNQYELYKQNQASTNAFQKMTQQMQRKAGITPKSTQKKPLKKGVPTSAEDMFGN